LCSEGSKLTAKSGASSKPWRSFRISFEFCKKLIWCKISLVSINQEVSPLAEKQERNWIPLVVAGAIVLVVVVVATLSLNGGDQGKTTVMPANAPLDPYAASLTLDGLTMSESGNLAGGKVTYIDGHIANHGPRTVTAVSVQVLFRDFAHAVTQNETKPLKLIRAREPAVDVEAVSAAPLKPGDEHEFRLIFDSVKTDWDGAYPELRVLHVETK
jgi:hypothetical protein